MVRSDSKKRIGGNDVMISFLTEVMQKTGLPDALEIGSSVRRLRVPFGELPGYLYHLKRCPEYTLVDWKEDGKYLLVRLEAKDFHVNADWAQLLFSCQDFVIQPINGDSVGITFRIPLPHEL